MLSINNRYQHIKSPAFGAVQRINFVFVDENKPIQKQKKEVKKTLDDLKLLIYDKIQKHPKVDPEIICLNPRMPCPMFT